MKNMQALSCNFYARLLLFYSGLYAVSAVPTVFDMYKDRKLYYKSHLVNETVLVATLTAIGGFYT